MRRYETMYIMDPELNEEARDGFFGRVQDLLDKHGGLMVEQDQWGLRKLAYEVKKRKRGFYVCMNYCAPSAFVDEFERIMRIDERVIRYLTVLLDAEVSLDAVREEMARKEEEKRRAAEEAQRKREEAEARRAQAQAEAEARQAQAARQQAASQNAADQDAGAKVSVEPASQAEPQPDEAGGAAAQVQDGEGVENPAGATEMKTAENEQKSEEE